MKKGSIKNTRINSEVMKEIATIIHNELNDPHISPFATVTDCIVSPDLHSCRVSVSLLSGTPKEKEETIAALTKATPYIRKQLAKTINLRITPEIKFYLDESMEYGSYISNRIEEVMAKDREAIANRHEDDLENE